MAQHHPDTLTTLSQHTPDLFLNIARLLPKDDILRLTSTNRMFKNFGGVNVIAGRSLRDETIKEKLRDSFGEQYRGGMGPLMPAMIGRNTMLERLGRPFVFPETHAAFHATNALFAPIDDM